MKDQKTLKIEYVQELPKVWKDQKMIDYCTKKAAYIVELDDGTLTEIERPEIEKDFCFGHGYCGVSTEEEERTAHNNANFARTNESYFLEKNLEPLDRWISDLKATFEDCPEYRIYKRPHYYSQTADCRLSGLTWVRYYDRIPEDCTELSKDEVLRLIEGYEEVKKAFIKRLNTYLKRYGLSKLNVWTYLVD